MHGRRSLYVRLWLEMRLTSLRLRETIQRAILQISGPCHWATLRRHLRATLFLHRGIHRPLSQPMNRATENAREAMRVCACGMSEAGKDNKVGMFPGNR